MKSNEVPMRRCVGCHQSKEKSELSRYTLADGKLIADNEKKLSGRGVYICKDSESCRKKARKRWRFNDEQQ